MRFQHLISSFLLLASASTLLVGCSTQNIKKIPSENQNSRVSILVMHYTTGDYADSLHVLTERTNRPVSSHYLIPEDGDPSYGSDEIVIHQLVEETERAWHAGRSKWQNKTALNDQSIGIEIVNRAYCRKSERPEYQNAAAVAADEDANKHVPQLCYYPDFSEKQIAKVIELSKGILARHPDIRPTNVIGHSDVAPARKIDPGPRFPWQRLYKEGIGAWYEDHTLFAYWELFQGEMPHIIAIQRALRTYGWDIEISGELDQQTKNVLRAFQLHFDPMQVTQEPHLHTAAKLFALIDRYYPKRMPEICAPIETPAQNITENRGDQETELTASCPIELQSAALEPLADET